ncbi:MAG: hypothetical protein LAT54_08000, partial [Cryomorphaceae bacterium]|nr:hypothetical protein [Cryomorphaceae bacterium]
MTERVFICLCFVFSIISVVDGKVNNGILDSSQSKQNEIVNEKGNDKKFVENKGQIIQSNGENADFVSFIYQSKNTNIYLLRQGGIAFQFYRIHYPEGYEAALSLNDDIFNENKEDIFSLSKKIECETHRMDMELLGCNPEAKIIKSEKSIDYENHYTHNALNVHHYGRVTYKNVYPNIDWVIYPNDEGGIKYDFVIHPGGDPNMIRLKFTNHDTLYINEFGALIHKNSLGHFTEKKPVSYQNNDIINSNFILEENVVTFHIDEYDVNSTLVIDPDRIWGTYYGGSS